LLVGGLWTSVPVWALVRCGDAVFLFCVAALASNSGLFTVVRLALRVLDVSVDCHRRLCVQNYQRRTFLLFRVRLGLSRRSCRQFMSLLSTSQSTTNWSTKLRPDLRVVSGGPMPHPNR